MAVGPLLDIELGLFLVETVCPEQPVANGYTLLEGYPWLAGLGARIGEFERQQIATARHLLAPLRTRRDWTAALDLYVSVPEHLRGYLLDDESGRSVRRAPSLAPNRFAVFGQALRSPPPFRRLTLRRAGAGRYMVVTGNRPTSVTVPESVVREHGPTGHDVAARADRKPVTFTWEELAETAAWLDDREAATLPVAQRRGWQRLFGRLRLRSRAADHFVDADQLTVEGVVHLIGMVGAGKSTLMELMAVCAARRGQRTTLVVGDVLAVLRHAARFTSLGIQAAPVVGASSRLRHLNRLHQVHASQPRPGSQLSGFGPEHDLLSTACPLDALRDATTPWEFRDAPCRDGLTQWTSQEEDASSDKLFGCPLWGQCQRHRSSRDLVEALVWVATPASLVHTRVPAEVNPEQLRYLELVWRRSDLVIIDEADQVQAQLDSMFSPGQTLFGHDQDAWLELLMEHTDRELRRHNRSQFADRPVREWSTRLDTSRATANRLYALLQRNRLPRGGSTLQKWIGRDCFTEWTLADKLVRAWSGIDRPDPANQRYATLRKAFDSFLLDPLGIQGRADDDNIANELVNLTRSLINLADEDERASRIRQWLSLLQTQLPPAPGHSYNGASADDDDDLDEQVLRAEFTLQLAVLSNTLNTLIRGWRAVDGPLNLDAASTHVFQNPPEDYTPVLPAPPMGSVLGYQYNDDAERPDDMGQLRFFRCTGVGRWAMLNLHRLFAADSPSGPAVLLMSGTSWAGTSPRYDIQVPVTAALLAPDDEVTAIGQSQFFLDVVHGEQGPIAVSGQRGERRHAALRTIIRKLAAKTRPDVPSRLEAELDMLPEDRRRILLVVGSYNEAREVAEGLVEVRGDWRGQVRHLVADDSEFTSDWQPTLRRGDVSRLATTDARFLVAPLLAIERGHNILNDSGQAAIGSAYFLVRPHPRPDDITYPVQSMSRRAVDLIRKLETRGHSYPTESLNSITTAARRDSYKLWQQMLTVPLVYGSLDENDDRPALSWTQMVTIWQVIGRLVRGGCPARVHFCDAKFAPDPEDPASSLLVGMRSALGRFLDPDAAPAPYERELAEALYGPLYRGLTSLLGER